MQAWVRRHYVGLLALFVALGGTAFAAATAPKNSVTSKSIKKGAVKSVDVRDDGIKGIDVDEATLELPSFPGLFASIYSDENPVPPANPETTVLNGQYSRTFVTPADGQLLVFASLSTLGITCSAGTGAAFLYLDGIGVPGSGQVLPGNSTLESFTPLALTEVVPAGTHTLTIALDCPTGNKMGDTSAGDGDLGAVLLDR